jgi:alpha-2-macroglobulin
MFTRGLGHLQQDANGTPSNFREARNQAYEIYLLARNGTVVTNALEHNHNWFEANAKDGWCDDVAAAYEASTYALLKNQDQADVLIKRFDLINGKHRWPQEEVDYDDDLGRASQYIYLLSRHFPERLKTLSPDDLMTLAYPIITEDYNTISSAEAILALDSYGRVMKESFLAENMEIDQMTGGVSRKLPLSPGLYPEAVFDRDAESLIFKKSQGGGNLPRGVFYQITESGFDQTTIAVPMSEGIEVSREYRNKHNNPVTTAQLGEELTVVVRVRSTDNQNLENVAIEDLLPGGFEIVEESVHTGTCSDWGDIEYADVREDRLLAFGTVTGSDTEITYRIKATNRGTYTIPPVQAEAMYHQKIRARGVSGTLTVAD